jgi:hypothetical protein
MEMMKRHEKRVKQGRVTDEDVERWVEDEEWSSMHAVEMNSLRFEMEATTADFTVPALGSLDECRSDGTFRAMSVQLNNMSTAKVKNRKASILEYLIKKYDVQFAGLGEIGINWGLFHHGKRLLALLQGLDVEARSVTSHNAHERIGTHQQGGVGMLVLGEGIPYYKTSSKDFRKLGRWCSIVIQATPTHRTRLVYGYGVGRLSSKIGSIDQQHLRYMQIHDLPGTPRELFESDFLWQLRTWRAQGDRLILMMDANEHMLTGKFCRQLTHASIELWEITKDYIGELCPNTHPRGSRPIDGVWATPDITITGVKWLPFEESCGDHRTCIFEFTTLSAIGQHEKRIVYPKCRRLTTKNQSSLENYTTELMRQFDIHRVEDRLAKIEEESEGVFPLPPELQKKSDVLDKQMAEIQIHSEKICRKIYRIDSPFTPDYSLWHKRARIFNQLIRMVDGRIQNHGILCKKARKLGIVAPRSWSREELVHGRRVSIAWKRELEKTGPVDRKDHLSQLLLQAEAEKDEERAAAIRHMMTREDDATMWETLKYAFKDNGGRSNAVTRVERVENGEVVEYTEKDDIERVVREETQERFSAAESSPFCQGLLGDELGYVSDTRAAQQILDGSYEPPPGTSDSVVLLLDEISRIGQMIKRGAVRLTITASEFKDYWRVVNEGTSSSFSTIHFGHYKAAAGIDRLCEYFAKKLTVIARTGCAPSRWENGLTVLLEKVAGVALVHKLRAILLMEADFNMHNRLIFGNRMMDVAREAGLIPDEQFAEKESDGQDGVMLKRFLQDLSRQLRIALGIISGDAAYATIDLLMLSHP